MKNISDYNFVHTQIARTDLTKDQRANYIVIAWALTHEATVSKELVNRRVERAKQEVDWDKRPTL